MFWYVVVKVFSKRDHNTSPVSENSSIASLRARLKNSTQMQPASQPAVIARNMSLVRNITSDRLLNAACHPILLKLFCNIIKFDNISDRGFHH